jgi:hypothetical protein
MALWASIVNQFKNKIFELFVDEIACKFHTRVLFETEFNGRRVAVKASPF